MIKKACKNVLLTLAELFDVEPELDRINFPVY